MGTYTVLDNGAVDAHIQAKLNLIVTRILKFIGAPNVKAIILSGGFGRGEGGVVINKKEIRLINDLDLTIVCHYSTYGKTIKEKKGPLEELAQALAQEVDIKQVDLGLSHPARFYLIANRVSDYEYVNGHKILYGDIDIKKRSAKWLTFQNLPVEDGTNYFLTRGSGLLIAALSFYDKSGIALEDRENFLIELNKAVLAMGDALLLLERKYHFLYQERLTALDSVNFQQAPGGTTIRELYRKSLQWKLQPDIAWRGDDTEKQNWFYVRDLFDKFFFWFEQTRLSVNMKGWEEYLASIYGIQGEFGVHFIKRIYKKIKNRSRRNDFGAKLAIMPGLLFSLNSDGSADASLLNKSMLNLSAFYHCGDACDWRELVINYLQVFHPGGVVKKVINREHR